jgi:hypothetical protein
MRDCRSLRKRRLKRNFRPPSRILVFTRTIDLKRAHAAQVDDHRAMDAAKDMRIEVPLQRYHAPAQQMRFRSHVQAHIVVRRLHPRAASLSLAPASMATRVPGCTTPVFGEVQAGGWRRPSETTHGVTSAQGSQSRVNTKNSFTQV